MESKFHEELKKIKDNVVKMGELSQRMLQESITSLKNQDKKPASTVARYVVKQTISEREVDCRRDKINM